MTPTTEFHRQDIVLFQTPATTLEKCGTSGKFVSRVIGMPGDTVEIRSRDDGFLGFVYVNGKLLDEPYVSADVQAATESGRYRVPKASYFVMGDYRYASCDSRVFGPVPAANMIGTVSKVEH